MLQLFNLTWDEVSQKLPELAEAGYTSLWLPPPTKGSSGYSVGYDLFDPFDLGDKDQRGTVATRYGTREELLRLVRLAHRFGLRVYFDNIMNHRAFDVPGYDANTPTNLYPGLVPADFHLRTTTNGFYRNVSNIRDYGSVWQVQNLSLVGLVDLAQENPNANFGPTEGSTAPKPVLVRHPNNPEYYDYHPTLGWVGFGGVSQADLNANPTFYREDVNACLIRAVRYLMDQTKCDGLRLDAVKHVPSYFFGDQNAATRDTNSAGYTGNAQMQFNRTHGFTDSNHRNSNFDAETTRNDALLFGEHLGEPPGYGEYSDAGMRLLDNPLRNYLNDVLGNPGRTLAGLEQRDGGGFGASVRVMHAQSHDNDYAARRELHNAYYFFREGIPLIYSDGYNKSPSGGSSPPFPRHANAPYLGQFGDRKMPDLAWLHGQLARGGTRPRWGDADIAAFERYDYREPGSAADQTVVLFVMNDNYGSPGDISFDDGVAQSDTDMPSTCYPAVNSRGVGLVVGFPPGSRLRQLADSPGKERACPELLVRLATASRSEATASANDSNPVNRKVYVGSQTLASGGGAIELKIPSGSYVAYAYQWPEASRVDTTLTNAAGLVASTDVIVIQQAGRTVPRATTYRTDGKDGDPGFNPIYPWKMRGSVDASGNVVGGSNVSNLTYAISVPVVTNPAPLDFLVRVDGSAVNALLRLDGGLDLNSHLGLGASNTFTAGVLDLRDNKPGAATDMLLGYEQMAFRFRYGPEKFGARAGSRNTVLSAGAETYSYTVGSDTTTNVVNGAGFGADYNEETCAWVLHDPSTTSTVPLLDISAAWRYDQSGADLGTAWRATGYADAAWSNGPALLAVEDRSLPAPIRTTLSLTNAAGARVTNYYFRTRFTVPTNAGLAGLTAFALVDDGAIFYVNGTEVHRYNMPAGPVNASTLASSVIDVTNYFTFSIPTNLLVPGTNVMAAEVHQGSTNSSDVVFGTALQARFRQRSSTLASQAVDLWIQAGYEGQINRCSIYYTTDGSNPEGAHGVGQGTTQVVPARFAGDDATDGAIDWWKATLPAQPPGTGVKYKAALYKSGAGTIMDFADAKRYALTQFALTNWNPATAQVWLHNNLATNQIATGLAEGFHLLRARAFLPRDGKSSVFNTFLQTFYYDVAPPDGVIAFPASDGTTLRSVDYDVVVRADETATEVEYNIVDSDPNNDDATTGFNNGNGLTNGVPAFARATPVTPLAALTQQHPALPREFRFTYLAVPASGSATLTVRLKEVTSATFTNRFRVLTRTVNCAAPPQTLAIAFPSFNGQVISLGQSNIYTIVTRFSDTLTANASLFSIYIDGAFQPRTNAQGAATYRFEDQTPGDGRNELRFDWSGMTAGQHYLQVIFNGDGVNLQASRLVRVQLFGVTDTDGDGLPDTWESQHGLDPNNSAGDDGANGDPDLDQFTNLEEYIAGTDPRDPRSLLRIATLQGVGQVVSWQSVPGKSYAVYSATAVTQAFEPLSGTVTALSTNASHTNTLPVAPKRFYRVRVLQ